MGDGAEFRVDHLPTRGRCHSVRVNRVCHSRQKNGGNTTGSREDPECTRESSTSHQSNPSCRRKKKAGRRQRRGPSDNPERRHGGEYQRDGGSPERLSPDRRPHDCPWKTEESGCTTP